MSTGKNFLLILKKKKFENGKTSVATELKDGEVVQIFYRGSDVKVMMTQETYFNLLSRLEKAEDTKSRTNYTPEKLVAAFEKKMKEVDELLGRAEEVKVREHGISK